MTTPPPPSGHIVEQRGSYLILQYHPEETMAGFDQGAKDLDTLADQTHIRKLLLAVDLPYDAIGNDFRIEGLNLAQGFRKFDQVAVTSRDPKQLDYLARTADALKALGVINDPDNFRFFDTFEAATAWIKDA
jgi:hypothetical protein